MAAAAATTALVSVVVDMRVLILSRWKKLVLELNDLQSKRPTERRRLGGIVQSTQQEMLTSVQNLSHSAIRLAVTDLPTCQVHSFTITQRTLNT